MSDLKTKPGLAIRFATGFSIIALGVAILVLASPLDRDVAIRTLLLGMLASAIAIPIGSLIAWVCLGDGLISRMLLIATCALLLVPLFIHVSGWDAAFGKLGWLTTTQGQALIPLVSGWTAAVWIHGIAAAPQVAVIFLIGLSSGGRVFEEQALLDTSKAGVFWGVTFKRLAPLVLLSVLWVVISCAREIAVTDLYQIGTLAEQIYLGYSLGLNAAPGTWTPEQLLNAGTVGSGFTIALIACLSGLALILFFRLTDLEYESSSIRPNRSRSTNSIKNIIGVVLMSLMVVIPIGNVILRACFFVQPVDGVPTQGYSIGQMFRALRRSSIDYHDEFIWSFLIALVSSSLIMVLATSFASAARRSRSIQFVFALTMAVCCALPGPFIGTTISGLFATVPNPSLYWLYNYTIFAPVLANVIFCWPVGALIVWFVFRKIPQDTLESSSVDGAGRLSRFIQFGLISNLPAIAGCWILSFAFCFGELSASQIVRPAGIDTVPRKMLGDLHAGVDELTAGITLIMAAMIVAISLVGGWLIRLNLFQSERK